MKKRTVNSGQYHAETALLRRIDQFLLRCKNLHLTDDMISFQLDTITICVNTGDVNILTEAADLRPVCSMTINDRHSVTLILKRPDAWPLGLVGLVYVLYGIVMMLTWDMTLDWVLYLLPYEILKSFTS